MTELQQFMTELQQLMRPELVVKVDVTNYILMVQSKFGDMFVQPPNGYYVHNKVDPAIRYNEVFYARVDRYKRHPLNSLDGVTDAVTNMTGEILMDRKTVMDKSAWKLNEPFLPDIATLVVEAFVKEHMNSRSEYSKYLWQRQNTMLYVFGDLFKEAYYDEQIMNNVYSDMDKVLLELGQELDFIQANKKWHLFDVKRNNTTLEISRYCDYRVYEWTAARVQESEDAERALNGTT